MIGWWDYLENTETVFKKLTPIFTERDAEALHYSLNNTWASQVSENHAFYSLIGLIRTLGYNEYITKPIGKKEGTLLAVDLDRINFSALGDLPASQLGLCHFCKFSQHTYSLFRELVRYGNGVGEMLQRALQMDYNRPMNLPFSDITHISNRVNVLDKCFNNCIAVFSADQTIV